MYFKLDSDFNTKIYDLTVSKTVIGLRYGKSQRIMLHGTTTIKVIR